MSQKQAKRRVNSANMDARRKAKRRKKLMRRKMTLVAVIIAAVIAAALIIVGIVSLIGIRFADETTLRIDSKGVVTMDEVSDFDESDYDKDELKAYTKKLVSEYNDNAGSNKVKLKRVKVKDGKAYLRMRYDDSDTYSFFTGNELFVGTVGRAKDNGYDFDDTFYIVDGMDKTKAISKDDMMSDDSNKVVIVRGNECVKVPGTITAVSDACTTLVDSDEVKITQPDGNEDATVLTIIAYE